MSKSDDYDWAAGGRQGLERFRLVLFDFDVRKAKQLIAASPREVLVLQVKEVASLLPFITTAESPGDIDLGVPIICVPLPELLGGGCLPVDGWHRIAFANRTKVNELPAVLLTSDEVIEVASGLNTVLKQIGTRTQPTGAS